MLITDAESKTETDEEHPHFALLAYLAEVAAVKDRNPDDPNPVEEEFTQASIENILTAAALAESLKEEIFIVSDGRNDDNVGEEDENIITFPEEIVLETVEDAEEVQDAEEKLDRSQPYAPILDTNPRPIFASDQESVSQYVMLEQDNAVKNSIDSVSPDDAITDIIPQHNSTTEENTDQDDVESLISFSEAEDTIASGPEERIGDVQIPLGEALQDALMASNEEAEGKVDIRSQPNEYITPNDTVGVNEMGDFVAPEINFFEDAITEDNRSIRNEQPRLALDNLVIFSLPTKQARITSPPKRQISLNEQNNVKFPVTTSLTHI